MAGQINLREEAAVSAELERRFADLATKAGWLEQARLDRALATRADRPDTPLVDLLVEHGGLSPQQRAELQQRLATPPEKPTDRLGASRALQKDLYLYANLLPSLPTASVQRGRQALLHWQKDTDLAGMRDPAALRKLPAAEQVAWHKLWAQVDALLARPISGE
jgi:hypothetical protein